MVGYRQAVKFTVGPPLEAVKDVINYTLLTTAPVISSNIKNIEKHSANVFFLRLQWKLTATMMNITSV